MPDAVVVPGPLRRDPAFRSLFAARTISFLGDSLSLVALMLHVAETAGQALAVALLLLVGDLAPALFSPLAGAIADRWDRRRVMIGCELVQAGLLVAIALALPPLPLLLVLAGARAVSGQVFLPASRAAVATLVPQREQAAANSALGLATNGGEAAGPLVAAALFPLVGVRGVLLVDAATFLLSVLLLLRLPALPPSGPAGARAGLLDDARAGLGYLWREPALRIIGLGFCVVVAFNGIDDVALVVLARDTFDAGSSAAALLLAAVGLGLFAGYALLARWSSRAALPWLLVAGFAVSSVGNLLTGLAWAVGMAFALQAVRGLGIAAMDVATNTLLPRLAPDALLGRVFGNLYGAIGLAAGLSYVGGGLLLDATSAPVTFVVAGAGGTLATVAVAVALPRALRRSRQP
ncbi:MFS transporter [Jiangella sp. DSM 45060]|uniref:MFS transporter n=1 Tax=Jiangella sp. DSM 45060 TaxID=1798224 RepID=UPI00087A8314|nr:MFS transporter [Jiangella sp. DSM 45060]SDS89163.1 Predicted arabinose efflux permease, MFS family [Jiangella sp. DSM 45060]